MHCCRPFWVLLGSAAGSNDDDLGMLVGMTVTAVVVVFVVVAVTLDALVFVLLAAAIKKMETKIIIR